MRCLPLPAINMDKTRATYFKEVLPDVAMGLAPLVPSECILVRSVTCVIFIPSKCFLLQKKNVLFGIIFITFKMFPAAMGLASFSGRRVNLNNGYSESFCGSSKQSFWIGVWHQFKSCIRFFLIFIWICYSTLFLFV